MSEQTGYQELASIIEHLPMLLRETRRRKRLSLREAAKELDISFSTIARMENGEDFNSRALIPLLRWLDSA